VVFRVKLLPAEVAMQRLAAAGLLVLPMDTDSLRAVTHLDVTAEQVERAVEIVRKIVRTEK
jgi:threonine aldolase